MRRQASWNILYCRQNVQTKRKKPVKFEMLSIIISCIKRCNKREATTMNMNIKIIITVITVTTI